MTTSLGDKTGRISCCEFPQQNFKASMGVSCRTYCCAFCAPPSPLGVHQRMLDGVFWYPSENARWTPVTPFPRPALQIYAFVEICFVEADIGFFADTPTIIRLEISTKRAKQACEFPAAHTVVHFVLLLPLEGSIRECSMESSGIYQRMLDGRPLVSIRECSDGHRRPHSLVLCSRNTLFGSLAGTPLTLVFLPVRPPSRLHDKVESAPGLPRPRRMTAGASVPDHCRSGAGLP